MKHTIACLFAWFTCTMAFSQNCTGYYFLQANKTVEITMYNNKNAETGKHVYTIGAVSGTDPVTANISSELFNKGKSMAKASTHVECTGSSLRMDMKMFIPAAQMQQVKDVDASANSFYMEYPAGMKAGDALPDGHMSVALNNGLSSTITLDITQRKVGAFTAVTTPAGNWNCFAITSHQKMKVVMGFIPVKVETDVTEWFAPNFGVVKTESKYGSTVLTALH